MTSNEPAAARMGMLFKPDCTSEGLMPHPLACLPWDLLPPAARWMEQRRQELTEKPLPPCILRILHTPMEVFKETKPRPLPVGADPMTHVAFVLDRSGSMEHGKRATIEGFNAQIAAVRQGAEAVGRTRMTLVDFSTTASIRCAAQDLSILEPLTEQNYVPGGYTALYDAIGLTLEALLLQPGIDYPSTATLVTIFTDGEENSSRAYSAAVLRDLVQKLEATGRWTFALVGPRNGVASLAELLGIDRSNITGFNPESLAERNQVMGSMRMASMSYMCARASGHTQVYNLYNNGADAS